MDRKPKPDWTTPIAPAVLMFQAVSLACSKKQGAVEVVVTLTVSLILIYAAFLLAINRRPWS